MADVNRCGVGGFDGTAPADRREPSLTSPPSSTNLHAIGSPTTVAPVAPDSPVRLVSSGQLLRPIS